MITLEKFFESLEKIKVNGISSLGLVIAGPEAIVFDAPDREYIECAVTETSADSVEKNIETAFADGKWLVFLLSPRLPGGAYSRLKALSVGNRFESSDGEILRQPETTRIVAIASAEAIKEIEKSYPDFKFLFGPIIEL
jgi:hypothetical protein